MEWLMSTSEIRTLSAPERRRKRGVITMAVLGFFGLIFFAFLPKTGQPVTYNFVLGNEWVLMKEWIINSKTGSLGFSLLSLAGVALAAVQFRARKTIRFASAIFGFAFLYVILMLVCCRKIYPFHWFIAGRTLALCSTYFRSNGRSSL
jgi:simple sugar transport system permease protein